MPSYSRDLTITSVLADPMIRAVMAADGVRRQDFEALLHEKSLALRGARAATIMQARPGRTWAPGVCFA